MPLGIIGGCRGRRVVTTWSVMASPHSNSVALMAVVGLCLLTGPAAAATPPLPAPSARNLTAFGDWLAQLDRQDPRSVHIAVTSARNLLAGTAADASQKRLTWQGVRSLQGEVIASWNTRVRANASWAAALDCRFARVCPTDRSRLQTLDGMLRALAGYGGRVEEADGGARLSADLVWLADQLRDVAPADEIAFARLEGLSRREPIVRAGVLVVSLETVRQRLGRWQAALSAYPKSRHVATSRQHVATLLDVYVSPARWTPGGVDAERLAADRRTSYRRLLAAKPPSPHRDAVAHSLKSLVAAQGDSAALAAAREAVDLATEQALALQRRVTAAAGKKTDLRRLVREFSKWAKASDRRLAKLADDLSQEDARRLSTYAGKRLFPQIEALMALIDGRKGKRKAGSGQQNLPGGPASGGDVP